MWYKQKINYLSEDLNLSLSESSFIEGIETKYEKKKNCVIIDILIGTPIIIIVNLIKYLKAQIFGIPFTPLKFKANPELTLEILDFRIKIEIRHNEHAPPHFHVIIEDNDYSLSIETGEFLNKRKIKRRDREAINNWYHKNRDLLIKTWNDSRPTNCPVGKIKTTAS